MALTSLAATVAAGVSSTVTKAEELSTLRDVLSMTENVSFALGTGANQANQLFQDQRSLLVRWKINSVKLLTWMNYVR